MTINNSVIMKPVNEQNELQGGNHMSEVMLTESNFEEEVLKADTGSIVFLTGKVGIPDAIEDIEFPIYL